MQKKISKQMKQVMDWSAALWAGLIASVCFYLLNILFVPSILGGNMWVIVRLFSSIILGEEILAPPAEFDLYALMTSIVINIILSIGYTFLIAFVFHKWGIITGIFGGATFGLGIYLVNFYTLTFIFPWFFALSSWPFILSHIVFGGIAGGVYELLEVEEYEPA